jgi:hypothetical protein
VTGTLHGHSLHFLERLSRATGESSELALELYHTPEILRWVLRRVRIPEDRERVAISLDPEDRGPFLVATREGAFVTCLGRDMATTDLHLVPHGQALAHRRDWLRNQERLAIRDELRESDRRFDQAFVAIMRKGNRICREEFLAAAAFQIALKRDYAIYLGEFQNEVLDIFLQLMRSKAPHKFKDSILRAFWEAYWTLGHLALLATMDGPRGLSDPVLSALTRNLLSLPRWGDCSHCVRALWGLGRLGRAALPHCRKRLETAAVDMDWLAAVFGIVVIALRHGKLKGEALRAFDSARPPADPKGNAAEYHALRGRDVLDLARAVIERPADFDKCHADMARDVVFGTIEDLAPGPPYDFAAADAVPGELARSVSACWEFDIRREEERLLLLSTPLPWLARCEAEDLHPPKSWLDLTRHGWTRDQSLVLIENGVAYWGKNRPHVAAPTPGRNDPCPCGSGKKYKKCCMGTGGPPPSAGT